MDSPDGRYLVNDSNDHSELHKRPGSDDRHDSWTSLLLLTGVVTTVGTSIPVGYNIGVMNTPAHLMQAWCNESVLLRYGHQLTVEGLDLLWSTIISVFLVGGVTGSLSGAWLADMIGRKGALVLSGVLGLVAAVCFVACKPLCLVELMLLARLVVGLSGGLITTVAPMYLMEASPPSLKGAMGVLTNLGITFGVLVAQIAGLEWLLGTADSWNYLLGLYALLILVSAVAIPILPESPKYLYVKGLRQRALRELARLRGGSSDSLSTELEGKPVVEDEGWSIARLLATPSLYLPLALVCALQAGQQCSGINAVFYYSTRIFESAGLSGAEAQYANLGTGLINFLVAAAMTPVVNVCSRRRLVLLSCTLVTVCLVLLTVAITNMVTIDWMSYVAVAAVLIYVFVYGIGLGPIPFFIGSELFEVGPRPKAMALGSVGNWGGNFAVGMSFPLLQRHFGAYSFLFFATSTALLTIFLRLSDQFPGASFLEGDLPSYSVTRLLCSAGFKLFGLSLFLQYFCHFSNWLDMTRKKSTQLQTLNFTAF